MGHALHTGLKVTDEVWLVKERILPLKGDVMVSKAIWSNRHGRAQTHLPGPVEPVNVANILGVPRRYWRLHAEKGRDPIAKGEVIARSSSFFGLFKSECKSNIEGSVENISHITGQCSCRATDAGAGEAYLTGEVIEIIPRRGDRCVYRGVRAGIFESAAKPTARSDGCTRTIRSGRRKVTPDCEGKVIVGGRSSRRGAQKGHQVKARGVVAGGFDDRTCATFLA